MAAMTVSRIIERVILKIQDKKSFDSYFILEEINHCNVDIATNIPIKELAVVSDVNLLAGDSIVQLPDDYNYNLSHCRSDNILCSNIKVYRSRRLIDKKFGSSGSGIVAVSVYDANSLYVKYPMDTDVLLSLYYHRKPNDLVESGVFPLYIPENFVYNLFFNFVVSNIYDYIEDGIDGEKVNTLYHMNLYDKWLAKLRLFIGEDPDNPFVPDNYNSNFSFDM